MIFTLTMQVYIVSGGWVSNSTFATTETLQKDGGTEWQEVAGLPYPIFGVKGVGLDRGQFMITGECWAVLCHYNNNS